MALRLLAGALLLPSAARPASGGEVPDTYLHGFEDGFDEGTSAALQAPQGGAQVDLFWPGMAGRTCFRVPAMATVNGTLFAFAEARTGLACMNDDCHPLTPVPGDNRTAVVFRKSSDLGKTWSPMQDICDDPIGCGDMQVVEDKVRGRLVVQYASYDATLEDTPPSFNASGMWKPHHIFQISSSDMGASWSKPTPLAAALESAECSADGSTCDIIMGPGRGLQLHSKAHHPGRVLFCAHRTDPITNRVSPIWSSDNGDDFTLQAVLPHGSAGNMSTYGPDECQMAELENGTIIYNGRNNWVRDTWRRGVDPLPWNRSQHRFVTRSTDGGDSWASITFDSTLSDHSHGCQSSLLTLGARPSDTVYFTQPLTPSRHTMTVHRSQDGGGSWPQYMVVATGGASYSCMSEIPGDDSRMGLLYERDGPLCTAANDTKLPSVACNIVFTTFPTVFGESEAGGSEEAPDA